LADGFLRHATEANAVLGAYADGRAIETDHRMRRPPRAGIRDDFSGEAWQPGQFHFPPFGSGNDIARTSATFAPSPEAFKKSGFCVQTLSG
jgi:hypothetical protein